MAEREGSGSGHGVRVLDRVVALPPREYGRYQLSLVRMDLDGELLNSKLTTATVELDRSEVTIRMQVPQMSELCVRPSRSLEECVVRLGWGGSDVEAKEMALDANRVTFEQLTPGIRILSWSMPGRDSFSRVVSIPEDREVLLEEWKPNILIVLSDSRPLRKVDLILEIDEEPYTNLPADEFPADVVAATYRLRWQVELFFKECKSYTKLKKFQTADPHIAEGLIWGSMLAVLLRRHLSHSANEAKGTRSAPFVAAAVSWMIFRELGKTCLKGRRFFRRAIEEALAMLRQVASRTNPKRRTPFEELGIGASPVCS